MKTLNLVDLSKSDIKYKINKFPDGQSQITLLSIYDEYEGCGGSSENEWINIKDFSKCRSLYEEEYTIKSRLNNFLDLELIICAVASLRELGIKEIHLYTPYIMGARSDRKFEEGSSC